MITEQICWNGKSLEELSKEELLAAVKYLWVMKQPVSAYSLFPEPRRSKWDDIKRLRAEMPH